MREVEAYLTPEKCSRCGYVGPKLGARKVFECKRCELKIDRHLNAGINVLLGMCGLPPYSRRGNMGGVITLMGRSVMRDLNPERGEAQGFSGMTVNVRRT